MSCGPGADKFIEDHFSDCVYNVRDYIGFCLGLAAIAFWIIAQLPQYYRNYKTKSAEALSPWFLAQWLLGDTFNLIGALLQGQQLPTTVYTAMYFVIADMFMMMQYIYYGALQRRREQVLKLQARRRHHRRHHHHQHHSGSGRSREREALLGPQAAAGDSPAAPAAAGPGQQQEQQQQQQGLGQPSAWSTQQQQERRRVPQDTAGQQLHCLDLEHPAASEHKLAHCSSSDVLYPQPQQQDWRAERVVPCSSRGCALDSCSDSDCSTASSAASGHSSSKGLKGLSRNCSPSRGPIAAAAAGLPATCAAAAAASAPAALARSLPGIRVPFGGLHWGGARPVVAVAVLVCMGVVSLLPASTTGVRAPVRWSAGSSALQAQGQGNSDAAAARAMQAGWQQQQQQGSSIHLQQRPQLGSPVAADSGPSSSSSSSSSSISSSSSSGSSSRQGWARQWRVGEDGPERDWSFIVGTGLGYLASVLYLCSRVSQIHKNYSRKSSEGLALVMFIMAVCANLCTGTSILLRTFTLTELKEQLPWIIGSLGTISLDMVILWQSSVYSKDGQQQQPAGGAGDGAAAHRHHRHHHHHHHHQPHDEHQQLDERQGLLQQAGVHTVVDVGGAAQHAGSSRALLGRRHVGGGGDAAGGVLD